ncbi:MAG: hypothetical protein COA78_08535 [Blastopirellula sp.]|nr:MAG: hypothetical protein COA78_08535 [Blastopirellula sp.]
MTIESQNPYASPLVDESSSHLYQTGKCPECDSADLTRPRFTNWGGWIGPWFLRHVICQNCQYEFNFKSGYTNKTNIMMYQVFSVIALLLGLASLALFLAWELDWIG